VDFGDALEFTVAHPERRATARLRLQFQLGPRTDRLIRALALEFGEIHLDAQARCVGQANVAVLLGRIIAFGDFAKRSR
jgi:hypothetical protein